MAMATAPEPTGAMAFASLVPTRSAEDLFAERVRVQLGDREYILPVLPMGPEEEWKASLDRSLDAALANVDDFAQVANALDAYPDKLLDALIAYDRSGVLPPREEIAATTTKLGLLRAVLGVRQAANPLVGIGFALIATGARQANASSRRSSSQRRSTGGRRARSGKG